GCKGLYPGEGTALRRFRGPPGLGEEDAGEHRQGRLLLLRPLCGRVPARHLEAVTGACPSPAPRRRSPAAASPPSAGRRFRQGENRGGVVQAGKRRAAAPLPPGRKKRG